MPIVVEHSTSHSVLGIKDVENESSYPTSFAAKRDSIFRRLVNCEREAIKMRVLLIMSAALRYGCGYVDGT